MKAMVEPQVVAIEVEPSDSKISETTRMVYGKSFFELATLL